MTSDEVVIQASFVLQFILESTALVRREPMKIQISGNYWATIVGLQSHDNYEMNSVHWSSLLRFVSVYVSLPKGVFILTFQNGVRIDT